jgi:hypothetical protein
MERAAVMQGKGSMRENEQWILGEDTATEIKYMDSWG